MNQQQISRCDHFNQAGVDHLTHAAHNHLNEAVIVHVSHLCDAPLRQNM